MKLLSLLKSFYKNNVFPFAVATIMLSVSLFLLTYTLGLYSFSTNTLNVFKKDLPVGDYYHGSWIVSRETEPEFYEKVNKISEMPGVEKVIFMRSAALMLGKDYYALSLYSDEVIDYSRFSYTQGKECGGYKNGDAEIEFNIAYSQRDKYPVGSVIELTSPVSDSTYRLRCVGTIQEPCYFFTLSGFGENMTSDDFFSAFYANKVWLVKETPELLEYLGEKISVGKNTFFVVYSQDISPAQREAVREHLVGGATLSSEEIIENSTAQIKDTLRAKLLFPVILMAVTSFAFIDIVILTIHKRGYSYSVYMLCGASKGRLYLISGLGIGIPSLIPLVLNAAFIIGYPYLYSAGILKLENILYGRLTTAIMLAYSVLIVLLSLTIQFVSIKRSSAVDFRRRFLQ